MKRVKEYQEVMQNLYEAAMKYPDEKLAKAIGNVRDLVVEYKNIIDSADRIAREEEEWENFKRQMEEEYADEI